MINIKKCDNRPSANEIFIKSFGLKPYEKTEFDLEHEEEMRHRDMKNEIYYRQENAKIELEFAMREAILKTRL